jgi:hypothetical protein
MLAALAAVTMLACPVMGQGVRHEQTVTTHVERSHGHMDRGRHEFRGERHEFRGGDREFRHERFIGGGRRHFRDTRFDVSFGRRERIFINGNWGFFTVVYVDGCRYYFDDDTGCWLPIDCGTTVCY